MVGAVLVVLAAAAASSPLPLRPDRRVGHVATANDSESASGSPSHPASISSCNETDNYSLGSGSIAAITGVQSAASCCAECIKHKNCVSYTWTKPGESAPPNLCVLKDNLLSHHANTSVTSGLCAPPPPAPPGPCKPPPAKPYPDAASLPRCADFPDPFLQPDGTRVSNAAEWKAHKANL